MHVITRRRRRNMSDVSERKDDEERTREDRKGEDVEDSGKVLLTGFAK